MNALVFLGRRRRCRRAGSKPRALLLPFDVSPALPSGHPEGAGHGWPAFSDQAMDGLSENGDGTTHPLSGVDVTRKAVFFGYFLLGQQKKVTRPRGRNAFDFDLALCATAHPALA